MINSFFKKIRTGHLWLSKADKDALKENPIKTPKHKKIFVEQLSVHTTYVYLPSFFPYAQSEIQQMIDENKAGIKTADYLIFDLRDNGGGFDSSFEPLFSLMGVQEYKVDIPSVYASEKNTKSWEDILQYIDNTEDKKTILDIVQNMKINQNMRNSL